MTTTPEALLDGAAIGAGWTVSGERCALVPSGGEFEGQVAVLGETYIEGSVWGSLRGPGDLVLAPEARIEGLIECEAIASQGEVIGPIVVRSRARFSGAARLDGDLEAPVIQVEDDVVWNGRARIGERASD